MVGFLTLAAMVGLLALSAQAAEAVREGLRLCTASVLPSLFPFMVLSTFFAEIVNFSAFGSKLQQIAGRVLGCSTGGIGVFFLSLLGGYPVGPRLIAQLVRAGRLSREEAEHLLLFCNNAGPAFVLGLVGLGRFGALSYGIYLYLIHAAAAALTALLFRPKVPFPVVGNRPTASKPYAEALVDAIGGAGGTMVQLCSFITFFYTVLRLFSEKTGISHPLVLGFVELTQGILQLPDTRAGFVLAAALLSWGGLSVHCQTAAVLSGTGLPLKNHLQGKICQTILATLLASFVSFWL